MSYYLRCDHRNMAASILLFSILIHFTMRWPTEAQERIGCFKFIHATTVLSVKTPDAVKSIAACIQQCQSRSYTYAGVRNGSQCYCGDSHAHQVNGMQLNDSRCTTLCNDHKRLCGGLFSIVIYSVCSRGRYRDNTTALPNCGALCNCADNHICLYKTGSCPANCETGWSGAACHTRGSSTTDATTPILETDATDPVKNGETGSSTKDATTPILETYATDQVKKGETGSSTTNATTPILVTDATDPVKNGETGSSNTDATTPILETDATDPVNNGETGIAVSVSLASLVLIVMAALIVFVRRRRSVRQSYSMDYETNSIQALENGRTTTSFATLNYSALDFSNNGPDQIDGEDISKSDVVIHGKHEKVENAVVRRASDTKHANLKDNSLYGAYNRESDDKNRE